MDCLVNSLYDTSVTDDSFNTFAFTTICVALRNEVCCIFVLLPVWRLIKSLSYRCLTFLLVMNHVLILF